MTMNPTTTNPHGLDIANDPRGRIGMTLLEVLVALGILVAGLASVASLMPAAGSRLADAMAIDRAGTLAANAHADLRNRGVLTASLFPASTVITSTSGRITVIGGAFPNTPFASGTFTFTSGTFNKHTAASFPSSAMILLDDLQLSASNVLVPNADGVSYGVTVVPTTTGTVAAGSPVRVGVVVFKKSQVEWMEVPLKKVAAGVFEVSTVGSGSAAIRNESVRKQFFPACSWAFAAKGGAPAESRWLHVGSSWTANGVSYVSFSNADADIVTSLSVSGTLPVHAFTRVMRVDEQPAILK
jgi:type II secretory pathway pseudopilin PulG